MVAEAPVGQDHTPHHLRQNHLLAQVELGGDQASELEVIQRLGSLRLGQPQELGAGGLIESEVPNQRALDVLPLFSAEFAVGVRQLEQ